MRRVLLAAIRAYQRFVSPYKGFCCAYRAHTGRASCSALGYRAVRRHGIFTGLGLIRRRTYLCGVAHRRHLVPAPGLRPERGVCDASCDLPCHGGCDTPCDCDAPSGRGLPGGCSACDLLSCCDTGSCDRPRRGRGGARDERYVHIPPHSGRRVQPGSPAGR